MTDFYDMPKYVRLALNAASGFSRCYVNNEKAQSFLSKTFGLFTDDNQVEIENFGKINFDWRIQKWYVM